VKQTARQEGFSLIELLIVVAIILIIAAIAIPNLLRSKMAANESSAVGSLRTINTAQVTYATAYPSLGYADTLIKLGGAAPCTALPANACLLDNVLANASAAATAKSGYWFGIAGANAAPTTTYTYTALAVTVGSSGQRGFFTDQSGVIRYTVNGSAPTVASSPIQ
jgi:type IV pilus assembly protein PilA